MGFMARQNEIYFFKYSCDKKFFLIKKSKEIELKIISNNIKLKSNFNYMSLHAVKSSIIAIHIPL